jgi:beta-lactamase superfamily II metal-dependent hydrolase
MRLLFLCLTLAACSAMTADTPKDTPKETLDIRFVDTDGGAATLIITPTKESILIDCGNPGSRDAERIHKAATAAGLDRIDHLIITHWHSDHYGGAERLSKLMKIGKCYDRGIPDSLAEDKTGFPLLIKAWKSVSEDKSITLKPGDEVALKQTEKGPKVNLLCVCASGEVIAEKPGAKNNPLATDHKPKPIDTSDNAKSLGFVLSFGDWRFLDLGDLTWNIEYKLVSPSDRIGPIDVYQTTHHGLEISNHPALIRTVNPRVAIYNNGPRKGCHPSVTATLRRLDGIEGIYQVHRNITATDAENTDLDKIANDGRKKEAGEGILLRVAPDAKTYTVTIGSKGKTFSHKTRSK